MADSEGISVAVAVADDYTVSSLRKFLFYPHVYLQNAFHQFNPNEAFTSSSSFSYSSLLTSTKKHNDAADFFNKSSDSSSSTGGGGACLQLTSALSQAIADQLSNLVPLSDHLPTTTTTTTTTTSDSTSSFSCGQMFKKGDLIYYCFTCGFDPSCVLCPKCFQAQDHQNHDIYVHSTQHSGGCCDCGDGEAWKVQLHCPHHGTCGPAESILLQTKQE